jgi:hypothetical protein
VLLNGRSRIRNALDYSRAATCRDFACGVRETGAISRDPGKQGQNWPKRSQSDRAFFSNRNDEAESLLSGHGFLLAAGAGFAIWAFGRRGPEGKRKASVRSKRQIEHSGEDELGLRSTD